MKTRGCHSRLRLAMLWSAGVSLGWAIFAFPGTVRAQVKADDVATVLGRMRLAAGAPPASGRPVELLVEGKMDRSGTTSDYSLRFSSEGKSLQTLAAPLPGSVGFNGKDCWSTDLSGMPERLALHDLDRNMLWLGMHTGRWFTRADASNVALARAKDLRNEVVLNIKQRRMNRMVHL